MPRSPQAIEAAAAEVAAGAPRRAVPDRRVPDRLGHQHQHERQRGDRAAGQPRLGRAGASERSTSTWARAATMSIPTAIHVSAALTRARATAAGARASGATCCARRSASSAAIVKTGRTHLMDAMPVTLGQELSGWRTQIENGMRAAAQRSSRGCCALAQGGTAVGTGINAHPRVRRGASARSWRALTGVAFVPSAQLLRGAVRAGHRGGAVRAS